MKILIASVFACIFCILKFYSQTTLISEDFEKYEPGAKLVQSTDDAFWATWNNAPGGNEDPVITDENALSGDKSVHIVKDNDLVLLLDERTSGRYKVNFNMYVKQGKNGYFNLLHEFNASESLWAFECFMNNNRDIEISYHGSRNFAYQYEQDVWIEVEIIIDTDDDFFSVSFDGLPIFYEKWSTSVEGDDNGTLAALNFYGWSDEQAQTEADFFVDDIVFSETIIPASPANLTSSINGNDVELSWDAPEGGYDGFVVFKNSEFKYFALSSSTAYTDQNVYPGECGYTVRAYYTDYGFSSSTGLSTVTVSGGIERDLVLFEINTGTWCGYCPGAAMGADDLVEHGHKVAVIEYHNGDDYVVPESSVRENYYNVRGFPTTSVDGVLGFSGGDANNSIYPSYVPLYDQRMQRPAIHDMDIQIENTGPNQFKAEISVEENYSYFADGIRLRTALTESHIPESWRGLSEVNFVCRKMYPSAYGYAIDFNIENPVKKTIEFSTEEYNLENCEFVVFIQHDPTKEVLQTVKVDLEQFVSVENYGETEISVYPNPASDFIKIENAGIGRAELYDSIGNMILALKTSNKVESINTSNLPAGMYILRIYSGGNVHTEKIVVE